MVRGTRHRRGQPANSSSRITSSLTPGTDPGSEGDDVLQVLDAAALRLWCTSGLAALTDARQEIDDLNVYPVPDGDTGTNLQLTLAAVVEALSKAPSDLPGTVRAMVTGSLMGARGNSGVIISQLLRGFGDVAAALTALGPEDLKAALSNSATSAYGAVAVPVEGTVLTVARAAAEGALGDTLEAVVRSARAAAEKALALTPEQLPALKAAGVVDAGGRGWCVLLEALEQVVTGAGSGSGTGTGSDVANPNPTLIVPRDRAGLVVARESGSAEFAYEVQFLLRDATDESVAGLKHTLGTLGDCLVVVGGEGLFNVHVHVNDVGAAIEAGVEAGRPFRITVTHFADQVRADQHTPDPVADGGVRRTGRTVVAVVPGDGIAALFRQAGAAVVAGGPTANPSTQELLDAILATGAGQVVVLPNDPNVRAVAQAAASQANERAGVEVVVVPTRSVLQGLVALSVADPDEALAADVVAMTSAADGTRWAEITTAVRASETMAGPCRAGDALGLVAGAVVLVGTDVEQAARDVLATLLAEGGELVTVVLGEPAAAGAGERLAAYLRAEHPTVEVQLLDGGQPHYPFLLGVE